MIEAKTDGLFDALAKSLALAVRDRLSKSGAPSARSRWRSADLLWPDFASRFPGENKE